MPAVTPPTMPSEVTVAMLVEPLDHVPPGDASVKVVVAPTHMLAVPEILAGVGFTITEPTTKHPVDNVYVSGAVPVATPVTTPEDVPIVAIPIAPLLQVPPEGVTLMEMASPEHTYGGPEIADGDGLTTSSVDVEVELPPETVHVTVAL